MALIWCDRFGRHFYVPDCQSSDLEPFCPVCSAAARPPPNDEEQAGASGAPVPGAEDGGTSQRG